MRFFQMFIVFLTIISLFIGCTNTEKIEDEKRIAAKKAWDDKTVKEKPYPSVDWYWRDYFEAAVDFMNNAQRRGFYKCSTEIKKRQYLKRLGIDVLVDMNELLKKKMTKAEVKHLVFGKDTIWQNDFFYLGDTIVLMGSRFNGEGYTHMYFNFVDGKLTNWGAYSNLEEESEGEIKAECAKINRTLNKIIEIGESMESIRNKFTYFAEQNNKILSIYSDNELEAPENKKKLTPVTWKKEDDNLLKARIEAFMSPFYLLADKVKSEDDPLGYQLKFKEPYVEEHRDITYWHFYMPFGERQIKYTITFRDRRVKSWNAVAVPKDY